MKKITLPLMMAGMLFVVSCSGPSADQAEVAESTEVAEVTGDVVAIDVATSTIDWIGSKINGSKHNGTIDLKSGEVIINENNLVGGHFLIDMNTITPLDQGEEDNAKLKGHLHSDDFFSVDTYPEGSFTITAVNAIEDASDLEMKDATHSITGNLNLKGIEKSITIPAKVNVSESDFSAHAVFNLIRTDFNVMFGSDENDPELKDNLINKEIHLTIHLQGNR